MYEPLATVEFWLVFAGLVCVSYGMYLAAWLRQKRKPGNGPEDIPIWRDQSRAYFPGDIGLSWMVAVAVQYWPTSAWGFAQSWWFALIAFALAFGIFIYCRTQLYTPNDYTPEQWNSVTKRYHDFVMYLAFGALALYVCIPVYFNVTAWAAPEMYWLGLAGLGAWLLGLAYDLITKKTPHPRQHPAGLHPDHVRS